MTIPNWKKTYLNEGRKVNDQKLNNDLSLLLLEASTAEIKETFLQVKIEAPYDQNAKNLNYMDVNRIKETVEFLGEDPNGVMKEGLIFLIILGIRNKLSYKCDSCGKLVTKDKSIEYKPTCIFCKTDMCRNCYKGRGLGLVFDPCQSWITDIFTLPIKILKKSEQRRVINKEERMIANGEKENLNDTTIVS